MLAGMHWLVFEEPWTAQLARLDFSGHVELRKCINARNVERSGENRSKRVVQRKTDDEEGRKERVRNENICSIIFAN